jgi:hypothetical protein
MAATHSTSNNGHHESLDSFLNAGSSGFDLGHILMENFSGEAVLDLDGTNAGVPLHNNGH